MLYFISTVIIEVYLQCFNESVSLKDIGKPISRAEISSPSFLYFMAVKGTHLGSALLYSFFRANFVGKGEACKIPQHNLRFCHSQFGTADTSLRHFYANKPL